MDDLDLAIKLCAKALSNKRRKLFSESFVLIKLSGQECDTRSFFPAKGVNFHFCHERRKLSEKATVIYQRWSLHTATVSDGAESLAPGQISDEKNRVVAAFVSTRPCKLWISLLLQCLPVSLASYCIVFNSGETNGAGATAGPGVVQHTVVSSMDHRVGNFFCGGKKLFRGGGGHS